jgi:hypothetical protein
MSFFSFEGKTIEQRIVELEDLIRVRQEHLKLLQIFKNQKDVKQLFAAYEREDIANLLSHPLGKPFLEKMFESDEIEFNWDEDEGRFEICLKPTCVDIFKHEFTDKTRMHVWSLYRYAQYFSSSIGNNCLVYVARTGDDLLRFRDTNGNWKTGDDIMLEIVEMHQSFPYQTFPKKKQ